ncbi:MAG: hypothetical protein QOI89_3651 [Solirubrobacteraceae bacterium]|nr:hypothetical protein [Solirubrobacteraceae bacterium]
MMAAMVLKRAREALRLAEKALDELSVCARDTGNEQFRDEFVSCIAMIGRVGSMIDSETAGCRTSAFGNWWKATGQDPLLRFVTEVRNAEFKRSENRNTVHHHRYLYDSAPTSDRVGGEVSGKPSIASSAVPIRAQRNTMATDASFWLFRGGRYDGHEVTPLLRRHLDWLGQTIIPEAERLLAVNP